jgi:hypothetical protein
VKTISIISAAVGLAVFSFATDVSYVTVTDDEVGYTVELPKGFEAVSDPAEDPPIQELAEGKPLAVSAYVWEGSELEGMGFGVVHIGDGGVSAEKMESFISEQLESEYIPYEKEVFKLAPARLEDIGADSGTGTLLHAEIEGIVLKVKVYHLQKANASYLVILGWPMDAGFAALGEHIDETFRLK